MSFQVDICDDKSWNCEILETPATVQVVECYQDWCGPCKAIMSTFRRLYFDLGDRPLKFYTANAAKVAALEEYKGSCQPVFFFYKDGKILQKVVGVNGPELTKLIMNLSAPAPEV